MRRRARAQAAVGVALTWDGARVLRRSLPPAAQMFLAGTQSLSQRGLTALVQLSPPREIRICWVPRLRGGENTLTAPFAARDGKRILFRAVKVVPLGALLGVVYRSRGPA